MDIDVDYSRPWYHGSPLKLEVLRTGSTITQWKDLARIFSHKPAVVSISDEGDIQHTGTQPGYLYVIDEPVAAADVIPHPRTTMRPGDEWLIQRELRVRLIGPTRVRAEEWLSPEALEEMRRRNTDD